VYVSCYGFNIMSFLTIAYSFLILGWWEFIALPEQHSLSSCLLAAYDRKKYTWKLLYSHMMGFEVDFGHKQAADLIPSSKFDEKQVGYQALTVLLNEV
jgi:hypothetical protein